MNVGKYYLDSENCTPEEREWVKVKHLEVNGDNIGFNHNKYYLFNNFVYLTHYKCLPTHYPLNYPLYTVQQLKDLLNELNIYECW